MRASFVTAVTAVTALATLPLAPAAASASDGSTLFIRSAVEHPGGTATFPLHRGTSRGRTVYYLLLDSSDGTRAQAAGVNRSQKLGNAAGTAAVQHVIVRSGLPEPSSQTSPECTVSIALMRTSAALSLSTSPMAPSKTARR